MKKITIFSVLLLFAMLCLYKYVSDEAEWRNAQDALVRLQSGMQYESMLMVRSRLADADAAIEEFRSSWRIFPLEHNKRISEAKRGISYLSLALDWNAKQAPGKTWDSEPSDAATLAEYPDVTKFVRRRCENGQLVFDPRVAASGFEAHGDHWLILAEGRANEIPVGPNPPLDPQKEEQQCEQQQVAIVRAQNAALAERLRSLRAQAAAEKAAEKAKEQAFLAKYPYAVELSSFYHCSLVLSIDGEAKSFISLNTGISNSFRMQHSAKIEDASCDVYSYDRLPYRTAQTEIRVKVNGSTYSPNWIREGKLDARNYNVPYYQTIIIAK